MIAADITALDGNGNLYRWAWVSELAIKRGWKRGAELGVRRGHFSVYLVDHVPGLSMLAVDAWSAEGISPIYGRYRHEKNYQHVKMLAEGRPIEVRRGFTHEVSLDTPDRSLDFAFIDASHEYASVAQDIDDWSPKVKSMLLGHDWDNPDVKRAVTERYRDVIVGPDQCWAVDRPDVANVLSQMRKTSSRRTICEVHREIYDACDGQEEIRNLVIEAFTMAKKMDAKLREYKADWDENLYEKNPDRREDRIRRGT